MMMVICNFTLMTEMIIMMVVSSLPLFQMMLVTSWGRITLHHPDGLARTVLHQDPGLDVLLHRPLRMTGSSSRMLRTMVMVS